MINMHPLPSPTSLPWPAVHVVLPRKGSHPARCKSPAAPASPGPWMKDDSFDGCLGLKGSTTTALMCFDGGEFLVNWVIQS